MSNLFQPEIKPSPTLFWKGASGRQYEFHYYPVGTVFKELPGVYIFARSAAGLFYAEYVGETDNLWRRLTDELTAHHQWPSALRAGVTHIAAIVVKGGDAERIGIETDLRHGLNPPLNRQ